MNIPGVGVQRPSPAAHAMGGLPLDQHDPPHWPVLAPSMPVSSSTFPALPPQPS